MSLLRRTIKKPPTLRSNPQSADDEEYEVVGGIDLHRGYSRPRVIDEDITDEDELSDHVKFRLWLARQMALMKYQEALLVKTSK